MLDVSYAKCKLKKTFVFERMSTHQSIIFQQEISLNTEFVNLNHIFVKHCPPKFNKIFIYSSASNEFVGIRTVHTKRGWVSRSLLEPAFIFVRYRNRKDLDAREEEESFSFEGDSEEKKEERSKERTIAEVLDLVKKWRNLHQTCPKPHNKKKKLNLQEAAKIVGISKKSLDDYYCQLRLAESFSFDFESQLHDRIGVLRTFVKSHKMANDQSQSKTQKNQKYLKVIEDENLQPSPSNLPKPEAVPKSNATCEPDKKEDHNSNGVQQQQIMLDLQDQFYRGFEFLLDQPMDPFLNLNRNFSFRLSEDESNSILFF